MSYARRKEREERDTRVAPAGADVPASHRGRVSERGRNLGAASPGAHQLHGRISRVGFLSFVVFFAEVTFEMAWCFARVRAFQKSPLFFFRVRLERLFELVEKGRVANLSRVDSRRGTRVEGCSVGLCQTLHFL